MNKLIRFDWAIKYILKHKANFDILEGFLSELLQTDITIKSVLDGESNKQHAKDKFNRVDLLVETSNHEKIIIEVQCENQIDYLNRMLYGTSKVITEHMQEGQAYRKICKVISISIVFFNLGEGKDYIYKGRTEFIGIHFHDRLRLAQNEQQVYNATHVKAGELTTGDIYPEYYIIKVNQFKEKIKNKFDEWVYFLKNEQIKSTFNAKGIQSASKKLAVLQLSDQERAAYENYLKDKMYEASMIFSHYEIGKTDGHKEGVKEGEAIGIEKGIEKGKHEGRVEGEAIGIEKGAQQNKLETAKLMKANDCAIDLIIKITGLSRQQINNLN